MLLLSILPTSLLLWVINAVLLAGIVGTIAGFFIKFIPLVNTYRLPIQIISIFLLVVGVYWRGGYGVEVEWRARVAEAEEKVRIAEEKAATANTQIKTKIVEKVKVVKEQQIVYQDRIVEIAQKVNEQCVVAPEAIDILNQAAKTPGESK